MNISTLLIWSQRVCVSAREGVDLPSTISRHLWVYSLALDGIMLAESSNFGYEEKTKFTVISSVSSVVTAAEVEMNNASAEEIKLMSSSVDTDISNIDDTNSTMNPERLSNFSDKPLGNDDRSSPTMLSSS